MLFGAFEDIASKKKPPLNDVCKAARLQFARNHMIWLKEWNYVVFLDEKKFNLNGPEGYNYYYNDVRKDEFILSRHHSCAGGVMVWVAVLWYGTSEL